MKCTNHPEREAAGVCVSCGKPFCRDCLIEMDGRYFCALHLREISDQDFPEPPAKCYSIFVGLALLFGLTGAHYFYSGSTGSAVMMLGLSLLVSFFGSISGGIGFGLLIVLEIVALFQAIFTKKDGYGRPLV